MCSSCFQLSRRCYDYRDWENASCVAVCVLRVEGEKRMKNYSILLWAMHFMASHLLVNHQRQTTLIKLQLHFSM